MKSKSILKKLSFALLIVYSVSSCRSEMPRVANTTYNVMEIKLSNKSLTTNYSASITGRQSVEIRPQVGGVITKVCIDEGAKVKQGQTLFIIDQIPYETALQTAIANVKSAEASVSTAKLTVDSKQILHDQNVVSDFDLQTAKNDLLVAQAALAQMKAMEVSARNNLSYTLVKSPVNGVTSMIPYRVGALVSSSIATPLVNVSDDAEMYVYFSMTENQLLALSREKGGVDEILSSMPEVSLQLSDGTTYGEKGKIDAISGLIDAKTGSVSVRATFPNKDGVLRSGGAGSVIFPYDVNDCVVIPQAATYEIQNKIFVYKVVDGKSVSTPITVFSSNDGREYIVTSGLNVGDVIVAEGAGLLQDGMPVTASQPKVN